MSISISKTAETVEFRNSNGQLCGIYHYTDPYKSFFRGLFTPSGKDVVAPPAPDHPHHKGLQFGLTTNKANFWEEPGAAVPNHDLPFGQQHTTKLELLSSGEGIGFTQNVWWRVDQQSIFTEIFTETRTISVKEMNDAYAWTWYTKLTAARADVQITKSVWNDPSYCSPDYGYCGLGLRLAPKFFETGAVLPSSPRCASTPEYVAFKGQGAQVSFKQTATPANALFVSTYDGKLPYGPDSPGFAFLGLVPIPRALNPDRNVEATYVITVSDI